MNKKQKKVFIRIIIAAVLIVLLKAIPLAAYINKLLPAVHV